MYRSMEQCVNDLEKHGHLVRIHEEVDPYLEMAAIHLKVFEAGGPALLFENVRGSRFKAVSNLFGTIERSKFIFRHTWKATQNVIGLRNDPMGGIKQPFHSMKTGLSALNALPIKKLNSLPVASQEISLSELPQIHHWPMDG